MEDMDIVRYGTLGEIMKVIGQKVDNLGGGTSVGVNHPIVHMIINDNISIKVTLR